MALFKMLSSIVLLTCFWLQTSALPSHDKLGSSLKIDKRELLQDIVTWDAHSLFIRGERAMIYSGEFHPFRLPVPGLWLDVFQKIRALGFNTVSFYVDWALIEGQPGVIRDDGVFALEPFFDAALQAGVYLIARPGPYINAETSGGGFPGWLQRIPGQLRTNASSFLEATDLYVQTIGSVVAKAQITNGGPVILVQPENEYSQAQAGVIFPNKEYFAYVEQQYRNAGIVVPLISNDAGAHGYFVPGSGLGAIDIYGYDAYPMRYDCGHPYNWPNMTEGSYFNTEYYNVHMNQTPSTPNSIPEFQGGAPDGWGGVGEEGCAILTGPETERVLYKNNYAQGVTLMNLYMLFGGTNWGNLGHPGGYTSYDYGAAITEDRQVWREKYSELKLQANSLMASPAFLTAIPQNGSNGTYTSTADLTTTPLLGNVTIFFVVRHANYTSLNTTKYTLNLPTSQGDITVPQSGGQLMLKGRDSKVHVTDYAVGDYSLLYSTAEIFTWTKSATLTTLLVYGGIGELHEIAIKGSPSATTIEGSGIKISNASDSTVLSWTTSTERRIVKVAENFNIYILDRNAAYNYWVLPIVSSNSKSPSFIASAGYLIRNVTIEGSRLSVVGDINATTPLEIITGAPSSLSRLEFNNKSVPFNKTSSGIITASLDFSPPQINLPALNLLPWKYHDSLPELHSDYDDSAWTTVQNFTRNTVRNLTTPVSLYSGDYGYHSGSFLFRGHFAATGNESSLNLTAQGGTAFGFSIWLNSTHLGSWAGNSSAENMTEVFDLPKLRPGKHYVFTVLVDMMGYTMNYRAGDATLMKTPRGILDYSLSSRPQSSITWKITGNLGGENYVDKSRGPLNEGSMFAERQGWHLPGAPIGSWSPGSPLAPRTTGPGVRFFATNFTLDLPKGYDIPLSVVFGNTTTGYINGNAPQNFRVQLFVNGWQFGEYVNNLGPQTSYPIPEGIINHQGTNYIALTLWSMEQGARLGGLRLEAGALVRSGFGDVPPAPQDTWTKRVGAY